MLKQNRFETLNQALESEGLLDSWELWFSPINRDQTFSWTYQDGSKHGRFISVHRFDDGMYERPIHYQR